MCIIYLVHCVYFSRLEELTKYYKNFYYIFLTLARTPIASCRKCDARSDVTSTDRAPKGVTTAAGAKA